MGDIKDSGPVFETEKQLSDSFALREVTLPTSQKRKLMILTFQRLTFLSPKPLQSWGLPVSLLFLPQFVS